VRLVRGLALAIAVLLLGGGLLAVWALGNVSPPHPVLYARFTTASSLATVGGVRAAYQLWTDPTIASARLRLVQTGESIYYVRTSSGMGMPSGVGTSSGAWYSIGRSGPRAPWQRTRLVSGQEPSLLTMQGVRALFAGLRRRAGAAMVTPVDLRNHLAFAFPAAGVTWPFRYVGLTRVWLDAATGLPLQYRNVIVGGKEPVEVLTVVEDVRTVSSATLSRDFFTPPDRPLSPWDQLTQRVAAWLRAHLGGV
jgi:hypothetical protein